ncbi:MAG: ABC transporter ATP-binding protein [Thermoplasmata archaeon]|nr:MAG: ABC transporter ATP-binding protein [Thermoplasmata archaeon]
MSNLAIQVRNLVKVYGDLHAVDDISFEIKKGDVFAFLGPNGAGKTTTVEIIESIRTPTSGEVDILGLDIKKHRKEILQRIGVLPQEFSSFDRITVRETLQYYQRLFGGGRDIDELLKMVNLEGERDKLYMNLSGGLKQRVGIAVALVNDPEVVFLDEPTTGLDPRARRDTWEVIKSLKAEDKTIFLTTHYMEEAEALADQVAIIAQGKIIAQGSPSELIDEYCKTIHVTVRGGGIRAREVAKEMGLSSEAQDNGNIVIDAHNSDQVLPILNRLKEKGVKYQGLDVRKANLEEVFLALTGEHLREGEEVEEE